jgi:MFS transporter, PAT family, beta-lactamase induction signal transducer AmpG
VNDVSGDTDRGHDARRPSPSAGPARDNTVPQGWLQAVLLYRQPGMLAMLFLGFSSGLPFFLIFQTLSAWLRQAGIERATIGMVSWAGLFYTLQFVWAPVVDRWRLPVLHRALGRRRSWMLLAQLGIVAALFYQSLSNPAHDILHVVIGALVLAFSAATQDIAMNAWRIESASEELQGPMVAAYQFGYRTALIVASAGAFEIAQGYGWHLSYAIMAACGGVGIVTTLLAREPQLRTPRESLKQEERVARWLAEKAHWPVGLRRLGATFIDAVVCPFLDFFKRYGMGTALIALLLIGSYRLTEYAMGSMINPFYIDHHYTLQDIALVVKVIGLAFSLLGIVIAGVVVARLGVIPALVLGALLIMASNLAFAALARTHGPTLIGLGLANVLDNLAQAVRGTALIAFMSGFTSARYTATQFALLSSLYALPGKVLEGTSGFVVDAIGYPHFFTYTASLAIPSLLLIYLYYRRAPTALTADSQTA